MRNIIDVVQVTEAELQYFHAWKAKAVTQMFNLRRDDSKILCEDRQVFTKCFLNCEEEIFARPLHPFSIDCSLFICRDSPVCFKATEMVDTQEIGQSELTADTVDPPFVTGCFVVIPVIERVGPTAVR